MSFSKSLLAAVSAAVLIGTANAFTSTVHGETTTAVFSSTYDASTGSQDIALSPRAWTTELGERDEQKKKNKTSTCWRRSHTRDPKKIERVERRTLYVGSPAARRESMERETSGKAHDIHMADEEKLQRHPRPWPKMSDAHVLGESQTHVSAL
ncbi:hypothetical protein C8R44DRAFT_925819 [Mycena epipterygia]|nr:hypothetical protein C8R44DRAFT_925819 [Mycena epipterygia]